MTIRFEAVFPEFIQSCAKLYNAFVPYSLVILVLSFAFEFWHGVELQRMLRYLTKLFLIVLLTGQSRQIINSGQLVVERFLTQTGLVRPETLAQDYKDRLAQTFGQPDIKDQSVWRLMVSGHLLDALLYAFLLVSCYVALGVVTVITFVQKFALLISWATCPVLFSFLAIPPIKHLGSAHVMRLFAILCWPLGFAVAATFSDGLLNMALHDRLLADGSFARSLGATIESLLIIAIVGLWSIVSTVFAPVFIHRFLVGSAGSAFIVSRAGTAAFSVLAPPTATGAKRVVDFVREYVASKRDSSFFAEKSIPFSPAPPPPAPSTAPLTPTQPYADDATASKELEELLKTD